MANVLNVNKKSKKSKRGGRKKKKYKSENLVIYSTNAAGLKLKAESLKNEIKTLNAAVFTVQETHLVKKGKL